MISCNNCGSRMLYDIKSAKMKCIHCGTLLSVDETDNLVHSAEEEETFETKIYRCTQCGAELMTQENSAVSFCSFCGAQSVLEGEFQKVKKPDYVIPFTKTKEECKKIYNKKMMKAIYAPSDMRAREHIDEFRGIYMPYYVYNVEQDGLYNLSGTREYRRGDYIYTDHYTMSGNIKGKYNSITHDASSNFADNVSESIAPYDMSDKRFFREGYLHGFYGDVADVGQDEYRIYATSQANEYALYNAKKLPEYSGIKFDQSKNDDGLSHRFNTGVREIKTAMFPVWFLSTKRAGRMSYATINGQTGRAYADIPISPFKFIIGTILIAVPLFLMFQQSLTIIPKMLLMLSGVLALVVMFLYRNALKTIDENVSAIQNGDGQRASKNKKAISSSVNVGKFFEILFTIGLPFIVIMFAYFQTSVDTDKLFRNITLGVAVIGIVYSIFGQKLLNESFEVNDRISYIVVDIAFVAGAVMAIWMPVDDLWYYVATFVSMAAIFVMLIQLIGSYNIMSSRRPRTFVRRGGDDLGI